MLRNLTNNLLGLAEIGSNRLLSMDPDVIQRCRDLQGKCIEIHISDLDYRLYCYPGSWGIRFGQDKPSGEINASISGRLMALINLSVQPHKISTSIRERININGDAAVAQQLQKLVSELDIDWEEQLAGYTGDVLAFQIHKQARGFVNWLGQSSKSLLQTSSEYIREEKRLSPTQVEFERFHDQVTELKQDVERSEARLRLLLLAAF